MELVYLWVNKNRKITKQGFHFSPKFKCDYDENNQELTIQVSKNHTENFFSKNINVTAIVGENGSGKSSLLNDCFNSAKFYIFFYNNKIIIYHCPVESKNIKIEPKLEFMCVDSLDTLPFESSIVRYHNIMQDMLRVGYSRSFVKLENYFDISDFYRGNYYNLDLKSDGFDTNHHLTNISFFKNISNIKEIKNIVGFEINRYTITFGLKGYTEEFIEKIPAEIKTSFRKFTPKDNRPPEYITIENKEMQILKKRDRNIGLLEDTTFILFNYLIIFNKENKNNIIDLTDYIKRLSGIFEDDIHIIYEIINFYATDKSQIYIEIINKYNSLSSLEKNDDYFDELYKLIEFLNTNKIYDLNFLFYNVSGGEEKQLTLFARLHDKLNQIKTDSVLLLLDEPTLSYHPQWEKHFINDMINYLKYFYKDKYIHLLITSHSPFILSDLPKENVIFLKDGKQEYPFEDKQTFGANIHTLLSHGFFMQDGLMGEFAKGKINKILEFHKEVGAKDADKKILKLEYENKQKRFWQTQSILGEDYLKQVIKNHLVEIEKILLGKDEAKQNEIDRLRAEADKLASSL